MRRTWVIVLVIVAIAAVLLIRGFSRASAEKQGNKNHSWYPYYTQSESYEPYEKNILFETLKSQYGDDFMDITNDQILQEALKRVKGKGLYINVDQYFKGDSADIADLLKFAREGHSVLIASEYFEDRIMKMIFTQEYTTSKDREIDENPDPYSGDWEWDDYDEEWYHIGEREELNRKWRNYFCTSYPAHRNDGWGTGGSGFTPAFNAGEVELYLSAKPNAVGFVPLTYQNKRWYKSWDYFSTETLFEAVKDLDSVHPVAYMRRPYAISAEKNFPICMEVKVGKGSFYVSTTPILFSNFFLDTAENFKFVSSLMGNIEADNIVWDDLRRLKSYLADYQRSDSRFRYILSDPNLSKGFYFLCLSAFIYLLLSIKRRQRPIPTMDQNDNTSLEFTHSIARLYFLNPDHKLILEKKKAHFQHFVNKRYGMLSHDDEEFQRRLAERSGVDYKYVEKLYNSYKLAESQNTVNEGLLMQVANLQHHFYSHCK